MEKLDHPIVRTSSHAGKDYLVAILTQTFVSEVTEDIRVQVLDCAKDSEFSAPLDWVRIHTRPAYHSSDPAQVKQEEEVIRVLAARGYDSPVFDRGATDPMRTWAERNARPS